MVDFDYLHEQLIFYWKMLCHRTSLFFDWLVPSHRHYCSKCGDEIKEYVCSCCQTDYQPPKFQIIVEQPEESQTNVEDTDSILATESKNERARTPSFDSEEWEKLSNII